MVTKMSELIDLKSYPVSVVLKELLKDKTTVTIRFLKRHDQSLSQAG